MRFVRWLLIAWCAYWLVLELGCIPRFACIQDTDCPSPQRCQAGVCLQQEPSSEKEATLDTSAEQTTDASPLPEALVESNTETTQEPAPEGTREPQPEPQPESPPEPACQSGEERACYTAASGCTVVAGKYECKGTCKTGLETCINGAWSGACGGELPPVQEIIDGKDNNCDGNIDENATCLPTKLYFSYTHNGTLQRVAFHPFDQQIAVGTNEGVLLWDIVNPATPPGETPKILKAKGPIKGLAYISKEPIRLAYSAENDKDVSILEIATQATTTWVASVPMHSLDYAAFSGYLYAGDAKGAVWRWTPGSSNPAQKLFERKNATGESSEITKLQYVPKNNAPAQLLLGRIVRNSTGELSRHLEIWGPSSGWSQSNKSLNWGKPYLFLADFTHVPETDKFAAAWLRAILYTPDSKETSGYKEKEVLTTATVTSTYYAFSIASHPKGTWLAIGMNTGEVRLVDWRPTPHKLQQTLQVSSHQLIQAIAWSPQGNYLAAITAKQLQIWTCP